MRGNELCAILGHEWKYEHRTPYSQVLDGWVNCILCGKTYRVEPKGLSREVVVSEYVKGIRYEVSDVDILDDLRAAMQSTGRG